MSYQLGAILAIAGYWLLFSDFRIRRSVFLPNLCFSVQVY